MTALPTQLTVWRDLPQARLRMVQRLGVGASAACFFVSGFLSLAYEICWIRKASLAFGSASLALSTVTGVFFAGLAAGSYVSGRYARWAKRPLTAYAGVELAIAIAAIVSPTAFWGADAVLDWMYPVIVDQFWVMCGARLALVSAVLFPPAAMIGAALPLYCRVFVGRGRNIQSKVGLLYSFNTLGAALGCATCGFVLLPRWGVDATLFNGGVANLGIAGTALFAARFASVPRCTVTSLSPLEKKANAPRRRSKIWLGAAVFLTGFVSLGLEIVWARFLSLLLYNTVYTYTLTLTVVLCGLVAGSLLSATLLSETRRPAILLGCLQAASAVLVLATLSLPASFWQQWRDPETIASQIALVAILMLPSATLLGAAFPLSVRLATLEASDAAPAVGWLIALNTLGGLTGSLLVGFAALPLLGLQRTVLATTAVSVVVALLAWWRLDELVSTRSKINLSVAACSLWLLIPLTSSSRLPADYLAASGELLELREGLSGNLAAIRSGDSVRLEIDRLWQGENRRTHQVVAAHLPMLLHDNPRRIAVIGLGAGQTASRFLMYPIERMDCVEIESELLTILPKYFHGAWLKDPRVRCIVEDGRNYIWHTERQYDVISIEVGQAFRPSVAGFYTRDFYERAKTKLRPGGLLTQFVSLEFFDEDELRSVIGTFADIFPNCSLFYNRAELLLVGARDGRVSLKPARTAAILQNPLIARDLDFNYWGAQHGRLNQPIAFAANFLASGPDLIRFSEGGRIIGDDIPWLEYSASSHRTPDIQLAATRLAQFLTPAAELCDDVTRREVELISAIRQRNLANLLSEDLVWQARQRLRHNGANEAIALLRQALEHNDEHLGARVLLGDALAASGQLPSAIDQWRTALALNSDLAFLRRRLEALHESIERPPRSGTAHETSEN